MQFIISDRQTMFDAAVIALGSVAGVFALAQRNGLSITATLTDGQSLQYQADDIVSSSVRTACEIQHISPATDIPRADYLELLYRTGTPRPPVASTFPGSAADLVATDRIDQVLDLIQSGTPLPPTDAPDLRKIFQDTFDSTFS